MHGANRLGGNGVANSTVFGGIAGDVMPQWIARNPGHRPPDTAVLDAEVERALYPFARKPGDLNALREKLLDTMWDEVGVVRDRAGVLTSALPVWCAGVAAPASAVGAFLVR